MGCWSVRFCLCVVCAQYGTVFVNKLKGGDGSNRTRRRRERANHCKVCVSGWGLEGDILLPVFASALEAAPTFNRHNCSLRHPFLFFSLLDVQCLQFSPPPSFLKHLIPPSLDLEAPFVLLIVFFSFLFHTSLLHIASGNLVYLMWGSRHWGCHDDGRASTALIRAVRPVAVLIWSGAAFMASTSHCFPSCIF